VPSIGSVNLTSAGEAEGDWSRGSGCGHRVPHRERPGSEPAMLYGSEAVSPDSKQTLHDAVDLQGALRVVG